MEKWYILKSEKIDRKLRQGLPHCCVNLCCPLIVSLLSLDVRLLSFGFLFSLSRPCSLMSQGHCVEAQLSLYCSLLPAEPLLYSSRIFHVIFLLSLCGISCCPAEPLLYSSRIFHVAFLLSLCVPPCPWVVLWFLVVPLLSSRVRPIPSFCCFSVFLY